MQILKMVFLNHTARLMSEISQLSSNTINDPDFRRIWLLFELFTGKCLDLMDLQETIEPVLLVNPEVYVAGPCYELTQRQR